MACGQCWASVELFTPPSLSPSLVGILTEIKKLLEPLLAKPDLQTAFLEFTKPPNTYQNLQKLTEYVSRPDTNTFDAKFNYEVSQISRLQASAIVFSANFL